MQTPVAACLGDANIAQAEIFELRYKTRIG